VLVRRGHTEAAVDLARMAGSQTCRRDLRNHERGRQDGAYAGPRAVRGQPRARGILKIADLIAYRSHERQIRRKSETVLPTSKAGAFRLIAYSDDLETTLYIALVKGEIKHERRRWCGCIRNV
jgi:3,4-dihydroxy 2-butanone 4-phosphate synthase/GTP cyclohydrolase II